MKFIQKTQIITLFLMFNSYIYCNTSINSDFQQREYATKEFIRQELAKGTTLDNISSQLWARLQNSPERKNFKQAQHLKNLAYKEGQKKGCYPHPVYDWPIDPTQPRCAELIKNYKDAKKRQNELLQESMDNPEYILYEALDEYMRIEMQVIPRLKDKKKMQELTQEQQENIDEEIQKLMQKKQKLAKKWELPQESQ